MCTESITNLLVDRDHFVILGLHNMNPRLIFMHRVENELSSMIKMDLKNRKITLIKYMFDRTTPTDIADTEQVTIRMGF